MRPADSSARPLQLEPFVAAVLLMTVLHAAVGGVLWWLWSEQRHAHYRDLLVWMNPADFHNNVANVPVIPVPTPAPVVAAVTPAPRPKKAAATPPPPVAEAPPKATLIAPPPMAPQPESLSSTPLFAGAAKPRQQASRNITLRRARPAAPANATATKPVDSTVPPMASASLQDLARLGTLRPPEPAPAAPAPVDDLPPGLNLDAVDNAVNAAFHAAWTAPALDEVPAHQRSAELTISIGRDGRVIRSQMTKPSGSHALDTSILDAAARTREIGVTLPSQFPKESYDLELNFLILP